MATYQGHHYTAAMHQRQYTATPGNVALGVMCRTNQYIPRSWNTWHEMHVNVIICPNQPYTLQYCYAQIPTWTQDWCQDLAPTPTSHGNGGGNVVLRVMKGQPLQSKVIKHLVWDPYWYCNMMWPSLHHCYTLTSLKPWEVLELYDNLNRSRFLNCFGRIGLVYMLL